NATARQLIAQAEASVDQDPRTALRLSLAAHRIRPGAETQLGVFNTLTATPYAGTLTGHAKDVLSVVFTADGRTLATGGRHGTLATGGGDGAVPLRDLTARAPPQPLGHPRAGHPGGVWSVAFTADGRTLASGGGDGTVTLWDLTDRAHPQRLSQPRTDHTGGML